MKKAVVLLSSGLDSTVNLYQAHKDLDVVLVLHFNYGQRAAEREEYFAKQTASRLCLPFLTLDLSWFQKFSSNSLTNKEQRLVTNVAIDDLQASKDSAKNVWVPNRNGIFLNIAAAFAEQWGADFVVPGFNIEEAATFPDNTEAFLQALDQSFAFSTSNHVKVKCYTTSMNKTEIYRLGLELAVDYSLVWPCYQANEKPCGVCESCLRFENAKRQAL